MIDIKGLLYELGVDFKESGKNVGPNDINIDCPFCGAENHMGINVNSCFVWCWVCELSDLDRYPSLTKVIMKSADIGYGEAKRLMTEFGWEEPVFDTRPSTDMAKTCSLPKNSLPFNSKTTQSKVAYDYLKDRGYDWSTIAKYSLMYAQKGYYGGRIIIPVFFNEELVTFTSRSYLGTDSRYKHAPLFKSSERMKNLLYNYDSAKRFKHIYVLEGPFDVFAVGDDSVCVFRSAMSAEQRKLILNMNLDSLTIVFDYMAISRAYKAADDFTPFIPKIKVVRLNNEDDVADIGRKELLKIESETQLYRG